MRPLYKFQTARGQSLQLSMIYIYILALVGGYFYVGSTADIVKRLAQYKAGDKLPAWARKHKFLKVIAVIKCPHQEDENKWFKIMVKHFSPDKVRGGSYSQSADYLDKYRSYFLELQRRHDNKECTSCCQKNHLILDCPQKDFFFANQNQTFGNKQFESQYLELLKQKNNNQFERIPVITSSERPVYIDVDQDIPASIKDQLQKVIDIVRLSERKIKRVSVEVQTEDTQMHQGITSRPVEIHTEAMPEETVAVVKSPPLVQQTVNVKTSLKSKKRMSIESDQSQSQLSSKILKFKGISKAANKKKLKIESD